MQLIRLFTFFLSFFHLFIVYSQNLGDFEQVSGSPFATGDGPFSVAFSPLANGNLFAAAGNLDSDTLSVYAVDQTTGLFTPVMNSPFTAGEDPHSIAFSPLASGNLFAAVVNRNDNTVSGYFVDQITGFFTPVMNSPFATESAPYFVAFSPLVNGNLFAAVANANSSSVSVYAVNQTTGLFTPVTNSPFATGNSPRSLAFSPPVNGNLFAAVANLKSDTVSVYSVDQTTGLFTPVTDSPFTTDRPHTVAFSPLVKGNLFAAVTNMDNNTVSVYSVDQTTGLFTPVTDSPFATGDAPHSVAFSPLTNGSLFAAIANQESDTVSIYIVDQTTGFFIPVTNSPFATESGPSTVAFSPLASGNLFTAVANLFSDTISVYTVVLPSPPTPTPTPPLPPTHAKGCQKIKIRKNKVLHLNVLKWKAPTSDSLIVEYRVYRDKSLSRLVRSISSNKKLRIIDLSQPYENHVYYIVSVNIYGDISEPVKVRAKKFCKFNRRIPILWKFERKFNRSVDWNVSISKDDSDCQGAGG